MLSVDQRIRAADPARDLPGYELDHAQALLAQIADRAADPERPSLEPIGPRRRTRVARRAGWTIAAAAAAATAIALLPVLPGSSTIDGASPAAAAVLDKAATLTSLDPPASGRQYYRIQSIGSSMSTFAQGQSPQNASWYRTFGTRVSYVAVDGTRPTFWVDRITKKPERVAGPVIDSASPPVGTETVETIGIAPNVVPGSWQTPNPAWLAALPRDEHALRERMYADAAGHGPSPDGEVVVLAADVLRSGLVPADLRRVLFRVLRTVPGVGVTSEAVTLDGRHGVGIGRTEPVNGLRQELVFDPATGQLIGERDVVASNEAGIGIPVGTMLSATAVTRTVVDAIPADVVARAQHHDCSVTPDGAITCRMDPR